VTSPRRGRRPLVIAVAVLIAVAATFLVRTTTGSTPSSSAPDEASRAALAAAEPAARRVNGRHVVAISVDGLNPAALKRLGRSRTPYLHKLVHDQGAGTVNARTQVEMTVTLPNHTSMVTGRAIDRADAGHGVRWNDDSVSKSVHEAAGGDVGSAFRQVRAAGGQSAVFATKRKFQLFERSWPKAVTRNVIRVEQHGTVVRALRSDLARKQRSFYFLHIGLPDQVGHDRGFMTGRYFRSVERVDALVGSVMRTIRRNAALRGTTNVVLTADHGGVPGSKSHSDTSKRANYRVPFAIWGAGVANQPLYALNPARVSPGRAQPGLTGPQPIRNGEVANVSLDLLGLGPVPGSRWNAAQDLAWR